MASNKVLLHNGHIYTNPHSAPLQNWMVFEKTSGKILEVGQGQRGGDWEGDIIDLNGKLVLPGLQDAHIHVHSLGMMSDYVDVANTSTISEVQSRLKKYLEENPNCKWINGSGWDQESFAEKRYPNKADIDACIADRPVMVLRACRHIGVLNSKALEVLGITKETPEISGGKIDRDEAGNPTGILRELALDSAMDKLIKNLPHETRKLYIHKGLQLCLQNGITAVQTNDERAWGIYTELKNEGNLPIRVFLTPYHEEVGQVETPRANQGDDMLSTHRIKIIADGSLGAETAALRIPYKGTCNHGVLLYDQEKLNEIVKRVHDNHYRLEVHAIGDLAAQIVLNAFAYAGIGAQDRPILTHCQILGHDLLQKMADMGVIANVQPQFVTTDSLWAEKRVADLKHSYAWKTMLSMGIHVAGGSDAPIEKPNPFEGLHASIFRHDRNGKPWMPDQCLTFDEAMQIYTTEAAYAAGAEQKLGRLEPGFLADFVILNDDVIASPGKLLVDPSTLLHSVWVGGVKRL